MSSSSTNLSQLSREHIFKYLKRSKRLSLQRRIPSLRHIRPIETEAVHLVYISHDFPKIAQINVGDMQYQMRPVSATSTGFGIYENNGPVFRMLVSQFPWEQVLESVAEKLLKGRVIKKMELVIRNSLETQFDSLQSNISTLIIRSSYVAVINLDQLKHLNLSRLELYLYNCFSEMFDVVSKIKVGELLFHSPITNAIYNCSRLTSPLLQVKVTLADFSDFLNVLQNCSTRKAGTYYSVQKFVGGQMFSNESEFFDAIKQEFPNATPKSVSSIDYPSEKALSVVISDELEWTITHIAESGGYCRLCTVA